MCVDYSALDSVAGAGVTPVDEVCLSATTGVYDSVRAEPAVEDAMALVEVVQLCYCANKALPENIEEVLVSQHIDGVRARDLVADVDRLLVDEFDSRGEWHALDSIAGHQHEEVIVLQGCQDLAIVIVQKVISESLDVPRRDTFTFLSQKCALTKPWFLCRRNFNQACHEKTFR